MLALTWLYVPADRPDRMAKALTSDADVVIVDLEDAVAPAAKDRARAVLLDTFADRASEETSRASSPAGTRATQIRINAVSTPWHNADCEAVLTMDAGVEVRIPKVESAEQVRALVERLPGRRLHLLLESALGVERAFEIASAHSAVGSIGLGEADLQSDLRIPGTEGLAYSRARIVLAARAAGLPSPTMSVYANVSDLDGLAASCREGARIGFLGRTAIHPRQLRVIREAFAPSVEAVARAREVVARVGQVQADGAGVVVLDDGTFLDAAMVGQARAVMETHEAATR